MSSVHANGSFSKTLQQLSRERDELDKVYKLAESLENQKRDEEKTKKLQDMVSTKGSLARRLAMR